MNNKSETKSKLSLALSMTVFGTIGIFRNFIDIPSSLLASVRGIVGALFLVFFVIVIKKSHFDSKAIKRNLLILIASGTLIGFNWVFLFEAYNYTSIATATLCYYMCPTFIIFASPFVLKEKLTIKDVICALVSLGGMVLVSGITQSGISGIADLKGILFGLAAAVLYASVILLNKKLKDINAYDKTTIQLITAGTVIIPYVLASVKFSTLTVNATVIILVAIVCIIHTGLSYALYFGSMDNLKGQTIALFSYIDPVVALLLSQLAAFVLPEYFPDEKMGLAGAIGAVLILGSAFFGEFDFRQVIKNVRKIQG